MILADKRISNSFNTDSGIAGQTILMGATYMGYGGCIFGAIDRFTLAEKYDISSDFEIVYIIALGKPVEKVVLEDKKESIKYYRDEDGVHHVPKRSLNEIILKLSKK